MREPRSRRIRLMHLLGDWFYDHRNTVKRYQDRPEVIIDLMVDSLSYKLRRDKYIDIPEELINDMKDRAGCGPMEDL